MTYDKIILGAGLYGLYAAQKCGAAGQRVLVLERDPAPSCGPPTSTRPVCTWDITIPAATPRPSRAAHYFQRFCRDYGFCPAHRV